MARVVILGAGIAGHTAALHLRRWLPRAHEIVVISPNADWNWIPSNIWVGVGRMEPTKVLIPLKPIYQRKGIVFHQALATAIRPEGTGEQQTPSVDFTYTEEGRRGETGSLSYDYLINATGPQLNFAATPGLGPEGHSYSVCTADHATEAAKALDGVIAKLRAGQRQRLVIGVGHGTCTCEGAAFEYTFNVEHRLRAAGVRDLAEVIYLTNEYELGDFGVDGMRFVDKGFMQSSRLWTESLFRERGVKAITQAHVHEVMDGKLRYEQLDGKEHDLDFDFAMLLPPFRGASLAAYDRDGNDITSTLFAPSGFLKVDADYSGKPYDEWTAEDWPHTYESVAYPNIFAPGIAFAPPHPISKPRKSVTGTVITPSPPRTGMRRASWPRPWPRPFAIASPTTPRVRPTKLDGDHGRRMHRLGRNRPA